MKTLVVVFVSFYLINTKCLCLKPVRLGMLDPGDSSSHSISGLVYFLNHQRIYIKDFSFVVLSEQYLGDGGYFCAEDSSGTFIIPKSSNESSFASGSSAAHIEVVFPVGRNITELNWFGVCDDSTATIVLANIAIHPSTVRNLPCNTTLLGSLSSSEHGISGRVYLVDRLTYAILGFSYAHQESEDVLFWTGSGSPSINGYHCTYEDNIATPLPSIDDQDLEVNIPRDAEQQSLEYLVLWSRSSLAPLAGVTFSESVFPRAPPPISAWYLNSLTGRAHNVRGKIYALDNRTLLLSGFYFDGNAPATYFRAIMGTSRFSTQHAVIPDENGSTETLGVYVNRTITLQLPENYTVENLGFLAVWCYAFDVTFGDANLNDVSKDLIPSRSVFVYPPLPLPSDLCPTIPSELINEVNCKQLSDDVTVSWVINKEQNDIVIELCGCVLTDNYIAFGLSGSDSGVQMVDSDVTWTWMNNEGVHAEELDINGYSQCQIQEATGGTITRNGACPDTQNNVHSVSGYRDNCKTCIKYTRALNSEDPSDKDFQLNQNQWVIWSVGPVGSLQTPSNTIIPVPFKHYLRANLSDSLRVNFSRTPLNECQQLQCSGCDVSLTPWIQPVLDLGNNFTVHARIGQSGGQRGYAGITGVSGWGISWYINGLLIPRITLYRGFEYTFMVEGGDDPRNPARYHPFYITDSERGGYLVKSQKEREEETVYAGIDACGRPLGVGRYCEYRNQLRDRSDEFDTFDAYKETLELFCLGGSSGQFTWTPSQRTPDQVYYQCATHQFLGWTIDIIDPPPDLLPIDVYLIQGSPVLSVTNATILLVTSKPSTIPIVLQLWKSTTQQFTNISWQQSTTTQYLTTLTELDPADYQIKVVAVGEPGDEYVFTRNFTISESPMDCVPYLTNRGVIPNGDQVTFTFSSTGFYDSFTCQLDEEQPVLCDPPYVVYNVSQGEHKLRITPTECEGIGSDRDFDFSVQYNGLVQETVGGTCQSPTTPSPTTININTSGNTDGSSPLRTAYPLIILISLIVISLTQL